MENVNYKGREISLEDFLKEIFEEIPATKIKLSIEELKKYSTENVFNEKNLESFKAVQTLEDLKNFIIQPTTQGQGVKDLLSTCLTDKNISFNEKAVKNCGKNHLSLIFENAFDFAENFAPAVEPVQISPEPEKKSEPSEISPPPPPPPAPLKKIELDLDSMQTILNGCKFFVREDIDATHFELTEKMPVTLMNKFYMIVPKNLQIYYGAAAVITKNEPHELAAVGSLQLHEGKTHILLQEKNIEYDLFRQQNNFYIVLFPQSAHEKFEGGEYYSGEVYLVECQVDLKQLEKARPALCIDFGTSNTTVGSYGTKNPDANDPEIVEFLDETGDEPQMRKMIPTIVYIETFANNKIKYLFGYEALKKVIEKDYNPVSSVFYEIKRWINNIDEIETVTDEKGLKTTVSHREIIQAYLEHVLDLAEQYFERKFTKLHFTAPVKLKDSFIEEMNKMFIGKGRMVIGAGIAIDEGIAIIYNHIAEQMKKYILAEKSAKDKRKREEYKTKKIFIIDCGGGTTDLASCEYTLNNDGYSKNLNIITKFENGDSNFGGNNVTFRILQLLKIKLAQKLQNGEDCSVQSLIDDENKLLSVIDKNHDENILPKDDRELVYKKFDEEYEKAEIFVPTKFGSEELIKKKSQLKRNFYYLWQMAEAYKIQFYRANMDFVSVDFNKPEDRKIGIPDDDKYYLFVRRTPDGELEKVMNPMSGIEITNNDIHRLLYADIYSLLKNVLYSYDANDNEQELLKYNHYKLSGQSCKITLFNELLKEFIPGKYLRYGDDRADSPDSSELKLACINGSIHYMRDTEYGEIKPIIKMEPPTLIYDVCKVNVEGNIESFMLKRDMKKIEPNVDVISSEANRVKYVVISQNRRKQNTIDFLIEKGIGTPTSTAEMKIDIKHRTNDEDGAIGKYLTDKLDDIKLKDDTERVFALFAIPSKTGYGFYIYCFRVESQGTRYHLTQKPKYFSFENTALETFFDGGR
ncbi:MAG: hypothetical protein IK062_03110 [Selenomonadaceae bacterium]|nr:hypothetical protein [Selenomonadaceae bacterium]